MKLIYSGQAKLLMEKLKESSIDVEKFEAWIVKNKFIVGGGYIIEYLSMIKQGEENGLG